MGKKNKPPAKPPVTATRVGTKRTRSDCSGEECVTCHKIVGDEDEGVECQWCFNWEHKTCAGLTQNEYILLSKSSGKIMFYCSSCYVSDALAQYTKNCNPDSQKSDRLTIIEEKLSALSDQLESLVSHTPYITNLVSDQDTQHVEEVTKPHRANSKWTNVQAGEDARNHNVVLYGIPECDTGTTRLERVKQDFCRVFDICSVTVPFSNPNNEICDTVRLGKYSADSARPRPVLVKFKSVFYVSNLLNNKKQCPKGITLKPDLPPEARKIESLLLRERWQLIQNGQDRKVIRIRGNKILLAGKVFATVTNGEVHKELLTYCSDTSSQSSVNNDQSTLDSADNN